MRANAAARKDFEAGKMRRAKFIKHLRDPKNAGVSIKDICAMVPISYGHYFEWRKRYKDFAAEVDAFVRPHRPVTANTEWDLGFAAFRKKFFGMDSPWFHMLIINALEDARPGTVTLITIPPGHGKTSLLEDWVGYKLALDPTFRVLLGGETQDHTRKFIKRVQQRMEGDGAAMEYVYRFGPFVAPKGTDQARRQTWAADRMDVFKKGRFDERDYSLAGRGLGSKVRGTRTDLLIIDDPQSEESLSTSEETFRKWRHDWLSRTDGVAPTVILMTRVGEGDWCDLLLDSDILDHHVRIPVWSEQNIGKSEKYPESAWLWPEKFNQPDPETHYDRLRRNVGTDGWDLSYMQVARPAHSVVFTKEMIQGARDPMRTVLHVAPSLNGHGILVGLDPGLGVAGITAASDCEKFEIVANRKRRKLSGTEALIAEVEDVIHTVHLPSHPVTDLVIEANAFQRGLVTDDRILALQRTYGFRIHPHQTGANKYDPDFGVPQMVHSLLREEITWPWADEASQRELGELEADMHRWRQGRKGTEIEQDSLMSTWFIWLLWRSRARAQRNVNPAGWKSAPAPALMGAGYRG